VEKMVTYYFRVSPCKKRERKFIERANRELRRMFKEKYPKASRKQIEKWITT